MTGINHSLAGAAIALAVRQPLLIAPLAFVSHFVCDAMPHLGRIKDMHPWNQKMRTYLLFEAFLCFGALAVCLLIFPQYWLLIGLGMFFATLPDFLWIPYHNLGKPDRLFWRIHAKVQWGERPYGWTFELLYAAIFILVIVKFTPTLVQ